MNLVPIGLMPCRKEILPSGKGGLTSPLTPVARVEYFAVPGVKRCRNRSSVTERIIGFSKANNFFFKGFSELLPETWRPFIMAVGIVAIAWLFLYFLYKKKIFLKV